jgi:hypothetical protein
MDLSILRLLELVKQAVVAARDQKGRFIKHGGFKHTISAVRMDDTGIFLYEFGMKNSPVIPELSKDLMTVFFKKADEFYQLTPWELFGDSEYFGVQIPGTKELHFVSIMGGGGQCFGIGTYRGIKGLMFLQDILSGEAVDDPFQIRLNQDGLLLEFTSKKDLDEEDLKTIKQARFKPRSSRAWPLVRDLKPGYVPWFPNAEDIMALMNIISATETLLELTEKDPDCLFEGGDKKVPMFVFNKKTCGWQLDFWGQKKIQSATIANEKPFSMTPVDELQLQRSKLLPQDSNLNIELHDFFAREPVLEEDRPFYPRICAVLEKETGACLAMELISPEKDVSVIFRDLILKKTIELGRLPRSMTVTKPEQFLATVTLEKALNIAVKFGAPEAGAELENDFREKMESGAFGD